MTLTDHALNRTRARHFSLASVALLVWLTGLATSAAAQLPRGFVKSVPLTVANDEIVRQPDFWMMEVQFKPMRMAWVELADPDSGVLRQEQIWYLAWRAIRRPVAGRPTEDVEPINALDPPPGNEPFVPEFTLIVYDNPQTEIPSQILPDAILPEALQVIRRIERNDSLDTVSVVQDLPAAVETDAEDQPWIEGVATWRGVDPETDFFKVIMGGFSNGYEIKTDDADGREIWRKVIVQRFTRPGDRFDPNQREFLLSGEPEWTFQPDAPAQQEQVSSRR